MIKKIGIERRRAKKYIFWVVCFLGLMTAVLSAQAKPFKIDDTVFVALPSDNIKDDAFIIGKVTGVNAQQNYIISVIDYVAGHDYGLSCVPMVKKSAPNSKASPYDVAWDVWKDTTVLEKERLEYLVRAKEVMGLSEGKHLFIERNNLYIVFGRWKSDAPMLTTERLEQAEHEAVNARVEVMIPALQLAQQHRRSFYDVFHRPYLPEESVLPLSQLLETVYRLFERDKVLKAAWFDFKKNRKNTVGRYYFLIEAVNKILNDANDQLYKDGIEKVSPKLIQDFKHKLKRLEISLLSE